MTEYVVGLRHGKRSEVLTIEAEDALIAALKAKHNHPEALISYVRKSAPYRSRAVKDPRSVLADFGVTLPMEIEIRVWDSTAETRFLVLPMRPAGTDGWSEEKLAELVTRDSMIGTGLPKNPSEVR